ncbi:MAG: hypothetical protein ACM3L6_02420, partial [Deltaproteobacteria bacterium]
LKATLAKKVFDVGEDIRPTITGRAPAGTLWRWTPPQEGIKGIALEDSALRTSDHPWSSAARLFLLARSFEPGEHEIPALTLGYRSKKDTAWREVSTKPLPFTVRQQVEGDVLKLAIKGIKGPLSRPHKQLWALAALLAAGLAWGALKWTRRRRAEALLPAPEPPPDEIALKKIRELLAKDYMSRGMEAQFYYELSLIVRAYLEARFSIRAPEMTTEEFLEHMRDAAALTPAHKGLLKDFLTHCDLVKFARYAPGTAETDAAVASARRLIEETRPSREDNAQVKIEKTKE